MKKANDLNYYH